jgi:hypothetical protein
MSRNPIPLFCLLLFSFLIAGGQGKNDYRLLLKSGTITPLPNTSSFAAHFNTNKTRTGGTYFTIIQFEKIPSADQRKQLLQAGVTLLNYIPNNAYTVAISGSINITALNNAGARAIIDLSPEQKMFPSLAKGIFPAWSVKIPGTIDVWVNYPQALNFETVITRLKEKKFSILSTDYRSYHIIILRVSQSRIKELAAENYIEYVQPAPHEDQPLNFVGKNDARANLLNASVSVGGYNLHGEGVVVGIGDNADPLQHIDFANRLIDRNSAIGGVHGVHVTGTTGGAGIVEERYAGFAAKATLLSQYFSNIISYAPSYVQDYGMVVTNNSYGAVVGDCSYGGVYDLTSNYLDQQAFDLPQMQTVFAAGNDGSLSCTPYPTGFKTVLGGYQSAKNVIDVANAAADGTIAASSSKGPVKDGRIKPEITAMGTSVISCYPGNTYGLGNGTSMASPAVSGSLVLLYQRYRQLNANTNPPNALMKALICNGATDKGNPGPDYSYGFGWLNLARSVDMLNNNHYFISNINNAANNTHTISVPANTAQLKVMLYWNDPPALPMVGKTLVNDLDLSLVTPSSTTLLPYILDTLPANVNNPATTGADHINNIEQITIDNPATGNYTANVSGFSVTQNAPQQYVVVYDIIPVSTTLTFPVGREGMIPGETATLNWDSYGNTSNTFDLQYSTDNGTTWIDINNSVAANQRQLSWVVPPVNTNQALVRVIQNGTGAISTSQQFTILGRPTVSLDSIQCEGYIALDWTAVAGATDYEVMMLRGDAMTSVATTTSTSYTFSGLSKDSVYWVTVRAMVNGSPGLRATAISRQPNNGTCAGSISANDLKMDSIIGPQSGRLLTSTALTSATTISARIKNLSTAAVNSFDMKYFVNGTLIAAEPVSILIAGGATYIYKFATTYNFSAVGTYTLQIVVNNTAATDPVPVNDTMTSIIKQLANPAVTISLGSDFLDNIETATANTYNQRQIGLSGLDRYDFISSSVDGRLRTFINSGIAYSGSKALSLDADRYISTGVTDSLTGTFNLSTYNITTDDIRLDFFYNNHGQLPNPANNVWVRGNDTQPWIQAYDLFANQNDPGTYKKSGSIELNNLLAANSQNFSSSFQVRWGQWGQMIAADIGSAAGYTFDDIHLYKVANDMQMISIDSPKVSSCGLNSTTPVKITLRNSSNTALSNIPVMYRIDGGAWVTETIASVNPVSSLQYTFTTTANLSAFGPHTIQTVVAYSGDTYHANDTLSSSFVNSPVISSFPYLENFESGSGNWYAGGKNSSWEYGTPASPKINHAASGTKAWKTRLAGNYNDMEYSYLYSPCFNITGMTNPTLSFSVALDMEDCGTTLCDAAWVEYSTNGTTWTKLGAFGSGTNWYNKNYSGDQLWSIENYTRWHVATSALPTGAGNLRLRIVFNSDPAVNREGIAVDDVHIYDNIYGIYNGPTMGSPVVQTINGGNSWIDFTSGGQLVASVMPNSQNMGSTAAQAYINTSGVRNYGGQYYLDRNITIKPTTINLADSTTVRFYFLDTESEALINATGCSSCTKPASAYDLGVSKYSDPNPVIENGTVTDDVSGNWLFILPANTVKVPFDKGYYAQFKVKNFSEFWLNNGGFNNMIAPPVKLISFTAQKKNNNDVQLQWTAANELNMDRYEIELAKGNTGYNQNSFVKIGEVAAKNALSQDQYSFTDFENNKSGVRYYRLKMINKDGSYTFSEVRPVVFDNGISWQVYPNPSSGAFNFIFQANAGEKISITVYDLGGKKIQEYSPVANGFVQKLVIDLQSSLFASGFYMIEATNGNRKQTFKIIKE